jgi:hypothetical protein
MQARRLPAFRLNPTKWILKSCSIARSCFVHPLLRCPQLLIRRSRQYVDDSSVKTANNSQPSQKKACDYVVAAWP